MKRHYYFLKEMKWRPWAGSGTITP